MTNEKLSVNVIIFLCCLSTLSRLTSAIRCYQCSSDENKKEDLCGAYEHFDKDRHVSVDCQSEDAGTPGIFCVKIVEQGPRGFIWDGRWKTVQRRCASISETGVTGYCNWGHHENGVFWEECYCSEDECNAAPVHKQSLLILLFSALVVLVSCMAC